MTIRASSRKVGTDAATMYSGNRAVGDCGSVGVVFDPPYKATSYPECLVACDVESVRDHSAVQDPQL